MGGKGQTGRGIIRWVQYFFRRCLNAPLLLSLLPFHNYLVTYTPLILAFQTSLPYDFISSDLIDTLIPLAFTLNLRLSFLIFISAIRIRSLRLSASVHRSHDPNPTTKITKPYVYSSSRSTVHSSSRVNAAMHTAPLVSMKRSPVELWYQSRPSARIALSTTVLRSHNE